MGQSEQSPAYAASESEAQISPLVVGTSYRNSPISYREQFASLLEKEDWVKDLEVKEWALLQTCNRIEFVFSSTNPSAVREKLVLRAQRELGEARFYVKEGRDAIVHVFRVASGLDSMVVNEDQILDQLRAAGREARLAGTSKAVLSAFFDAAVNAGRRVRSSQNGRRRSVGEFALEFALQKLGREPNTALLVGTGKVSRIAAGILRGCELYVATRRSTLPRSLSRAKLVELQEIRSVANRCELIISATKYHGYTIHRDDIPDDKERVVLDLAFPRNIEPSLKESRNVQHFDLDDLASHASHAPNPETEQAERAVEREAKNFERRLNASRLTPVLSDLFSWAEQIRELETDAALRRLPDLSSNERRVVEAMGKRITSKLLAKPAAFAKSANAELSQKQRLTLLRVIFEGKKENEEV